MKTVGLVFKKKSGGRRNTDPDKDQSKATIPEVSEGQESSEKDDKEE